MPVPSIIRRRAKHVIAPLFGALSLAYFGYHAVQGDRGLLAYLNLQNEIRKAETTRRLIGSEREVLEKHVRLLRPDGLDRDMLEERARIMLNFGRPDEIVVMLSKADERPKVAVGE